MKRTQAIMMAGRIWILTSLIFGAGWLLLCVLENNSGWLTGAIPAALAAAIGSMPVMVAMTIALAWLRPRNMRAQQKINAFLILCGACCLIYGLAVASFLPISSLLQKDNPRDTLSDTLIATAILAFYAGLAIFFSREKLLAYFKPVQTESFIIQSSNMETTTESSHREAVIQTGANKIFMKGVITGLLILAMMIPTVFIGDLVKERAERRAEVVREVGAHWAAAQTLTGPYLYLPYKVYSVDKDKKPTETTEHLLVLPDNLDLSGRIDHQFRSRSIYKVLLYRASLQTHGNFDLQIPKEIEPANIQWRDSRICFGITDFKGIEEKIVVHFDGHDYELSAGLPANDLNETGLSAALPLSVSDSARSLNFSMGLKIKGSEQLHFLPFNGNSHYRLQSAWPSPSFDGSNLPSERQVSDSGFSATWAFNKANLPFNTVLKDSKIDEAALAFGVTMIQPDDGYAKTNRCVKYAILFIGLTFSVFFIVEILQRKPIHPIQYVLIGLALVIFYTLLLSISEFITFDFAYLVAALATILLISAYALAHFGNRKSATLFGGVLALLYGFIFVLIRLEDTALLIGSIGLFIILCLAMYASRKVNWYGNLKTNPV
jgi:inner membrane protein